MEKTNNTINTQNNANETIDTSTVQGELMSHVLEAYEELKAKESRDTRTPQQKEYDDDMAKILDSINKDTREGKLLADVIVGYQDLLQQADNAFAEVAKHFLAEQVQDVIYETHQQEDFRERIESNYAKVSDLWHTLDNDQKELLSDIMHGLGVSTGMLLSEVFKAGIKACNTHGETLESLNYLKQVDVSEVCYDALPTDRY